MIKQMTVNEFTRRYRFFRKPVQEWAESTASAVNANGVFDEDTNEVHTVVPYAQGQHWRLCLERDLEDKDQLEPDQVISKPWRKAANKLFQKMRITNEVAEYRRERIHYYRSRKNGAGFSEELAWYDIFQRWESDLEPVTSGKYHAGDKLLQERADRFRISQPFNADDEDAIEEFDPANTDMQRDGLWVYQNIGVKNVKPNDAPSPGAWNLLENARRNPDKFYNQLLPKLVKDFDATNEEQDKQNEERKNIDGLQKVIDRFTEEHDLKKETTPI